MIVTFQDSYRPPMSNRCSVKLLFPPQKSKHCNNCKTCHCQSGSNLGEVSKCKVTSLKKCCDVNLVRFCHTCQLVLETWNGFARNFHFGSSVRDFFDQCGHSNYFVIKNQLLKARSPLFRQNCLFRTPCHKVLNFSHSTFGHDLVPPWSRSQHLNASCLWRKHLLFYGNTPNVGQWRPRRALTIQYCTILYEGLPLCCWGFLNGSGVLLR